MKRAEFSKATKAAAFLRANGHCECGCGLKIMVGDAVEYDHKLPAALGGDNSLDNCVCLLKKHHAEKTRSKAIDSNSSIARATRLAEKRMGLRPKRATFRGSKKFNDEVTFK